MIMYRVAQQIATCFMVGYAPCCPGTIASALTALVFFLAPPLSLLGVVLCLVLGMPLSVWAAGYVEKHQAIKDPSYIVIDEFMGMFIALIALPKVWWVYLMAFLLFRIFDIFKPFPVCWAERLPGGLGIVLDDVIAGLMVQGLLFVILAF